MDITEYRTNPGRCAALASMIESTAFKEALEAIENSNKTTNAMTIAAHIDSAGSDVERRLLNQQVGREGLIRDLQVCSVPLNPPKPQPPADFGAPEAMEMLSGPDAPADPWQPIK